MPLSCFTCGAERIHDDGYLSKQTDGTMILVPVCDDCRFRHAENGTVRTGYLIEDRMAHGLPASGQGYRV